MYHCKVMIVYDIWTSVGSGGEDGEAPDFEARLTRDVTLHEHLQGQLDLATADPVTRLIGRNLKTWTDFQGWDPETNAGAQRTLVRGFAFATTPIPRSVAISVTSNF